MKCILPLQRGFTAILNKHRKSGEYILNFRSPDYSTEGGYRPVEIRLVGDTLDYVTEFSYFGYELEKSLDFDFGQGVGFQAMQVVPTSGITVSCSNSGSETSLPTIGQASTRLNHELENITRRSSDYGLNDLRHRLLPGNGYTLRL